MIQTFLDLPRQQLRARLEAGHPIAPNALDDTRYRGISLGLPAWIDRLAWKTFEKTFHRDGDALRGWNVRLEQTGVDGPVVPLLKRGEPHTFGHYRVVQGARWMELRYGAMVDPLVALETGETDWLLGRSDLLGVPTPSYFLLQRIGPLEHVPDR
jgi:hypothetical protein